MVFYISVDGVVYLDQVYQQIFHGQSKCNCITKNNLYLRFYIDEANYCIDCDFTKPLVIILFYRTGLYTAEPDSLESLRKLTRLRFFNGGFAGRGNAAYFIIGSYENHYIYLDPHFVQVGLLGL